MSTRKNKKPKMEREADRPFMDFATLGISKLSLGISKLSPSIVRLVMLANYFEFKSSLHSLFIRSIGWLHLGESR